MEIQINFIYKKGKATIAIDSGYKDSSTRYEEFKKINIKVNEIDAIFLTHIDK